MMLNSNQREAIKLLAYTDKTYGEIADEVGVTRLTLYNWRKKPEFQEALDKELDYQLQIVRDKLKRDVDRVYNRVYNIAVDSADESTSLSAGKFLIEQTLGKANSTFDVKSQQNIQVEQHITEHDILSVFDEVD